MNRTLLWSACFLSLVALAPGSALALSKFDKTHNWNLKLKGDEGYGVAWQGDASALSGSPAVLDKESVNQAPRPAPTSNTTGLQQSNSGGASADAIAFYTANVNVGSHTLRGKADLGTGNIAVSSASSRISLRKTAPDGKGSITWKGDWLIDTLRSGRETDPLLFSVIDLDSGEVITTSLFSFNVDLNGPGGASWQNGLVNLDGLDGAMSIVMDSPYITSGVGRLSVSFANGVITASEDSGMFDGLLPGVGLPSDFSFGLGRVDGIDIAFDFGNENKNGYDFAVDIDVEARVAEVPEPSIAALFAAGLLASAVLRGRVHRTRDAKA